MKAATLKLSAEDAAKFLPECETGEEVRLVVSGTVKKADDGSITVTCDDISYSEGKEDDEPKDEKKKDKKEKTETAPMKRSAAASAVLGKGYTADEE